MLLQRAYNLPALQKGHSGDSRNATMQKNWLHLEGKKRAGLVNSGQIVPQRVPSVIHRNDITTKGFPAYFQSLSNEVKTGQSASRCGCHRPYSKITTASHHEVCVTASCVHDQNQSISRTCRANKGLCDGGIPGTTSCFQSLNVCDMPRLHYHPSLKLARLQRTFR
jgi:hypothetical protein